MPSLILKQCHHQAGHQIFLLGRTFGDQQGEGRHAVIGDARLAIGQQQQLIATQELQEQQGADAFIAIGEGVVLDHEVEQMGRPQLGCGVERLAIEGLLDGPKNAC